MTLQTTTNINQMLQSLKQSMIKPKYNSNLIARDKMQQNDTREEWPWV